MSSYHTPVLVKEMVQWLAVAPGKRYIDGTVGGGGHTGEVILGGADVLAIDTDRDAIREAREYIGALKKDHIDAGNALFVQGNFRNIEAIARKEGFSAVDGVLLDLGVSSFQLDTPERGFSYRFDDAPLDLRLDQTSGQNAAELLETVREEELYEIIARFGEEELAHELSRALVGARAVKPIRTVGQLTAVVKSVAGGNVNAVLSRVFQALRIAVNDELGALKEALAGAKHVLRPEGRLGVITFHSLEDRVVKQAMKQEGWRELTKKPLVASRAEVLKNRRARSAKFRIAEKL